MAELSRCWHNKGTPTGLHDSLSLIIKSKGNFIVWKENVSMTHVSWHFIRHLLFWLFAFSRFKQLFSIDGVWDMLRVFEEFAMDPMHVVGLDISSTGYDSACFISCGFFLGNWIFINMMVRKFVPWAITTAWFELQFVNGRAGMKFFIVKSIQFLWIEVFIAGMDTLRWIDKGFSIDSRTIGPCQHVARLR